VNKENDVKAITNSGRMFEYCVFQNPGWLVLCPDGVKVAAGRKNKEAFAPLFFSCRQRSKVIFRVTRKYLALRGSSLFHPLPVVADSRSQWTTFFFMRPVVASRGCPGQVFVSSPDGRFHFDLAHGYRNYLGCTRFP